MRRAAAAAAVAIALGAGGARAAGPTGPDWAFGRPGGEAVLASASVLSLATTFLPQRIGAWGPDAARPFDARYDLASDYTGAWRGSLVVMTSAFLADGAYYDAAGVRAPFGRAARTSLVDLEALTLSRGVTSILKRATGRCRPRAWINGSCTELATDNDAFPSGHTSPVAALAGAHLVLALSTRSDAAPRWATFTFAESASIVTATLRVLAGAHSQSDVIGGWLIGHAVGALVALAHPTVAIPSDAARSSAAVEWRASF